MGSIRQERNGQALVPVQEHGSRDRFRAESTPDVVHGHIQRDPITPVERQRQLHDGVVVEIANGDTDERYAVADEERHRCGQ